MRNRPLALGVCLALLGGCSLTPTPTAPESSQSQESLRQHGTLEITFSHPPTVEEKAEFALADVQKIYSTSDPQGVLVSLTNNKVARIVDGEVVWASHPIASLDRALYVQDKGRQWVVAFGENEVLVFDAYARGLDHEPVRKIPVQADSFLASSQELYAVSGGKLQQVFPGSGYMAPVSLSGMKEGEEVKGVMDEGVVVGAKEETRVLHKGGAWKATGTPAYTSPSHMVTLDHNNAYVYDLHGTLLGKAPRGTLSSGAIIYPTAGPYLAFGNTVFNVSNGEHVALPDDVIVIHENIAYTSSGGYEVDTGKPLWEHTPTPLIGAHQGYGLFLENTTLFFASFHTAFGLGDSQDNGS